MTRSPFLTLGLFHVARGRRLRRRLRANATSQAPPFHSYRLRALIAVARAVDPCKWLFLTPSSLARRPRPHAGYLAREALGRLQMWSCSCSECVLLLPIDLITLVCLVWEVERSS